MSLLDNYARRFFEKYGDEYEPTNTNMRHCFEDAALIPDAAAYAKIRAAIKEYQKQYHLQHSPEDKDLSDEEMQKLLGHPHMH